MIYREKYLSELIDLNLYKIMDKIALLKRDVNELKRLILSMYNKLIENRAKKGSMCSVNGKKYEMECFEIVKHSDKCIKLGGGSSHEPDMIMTKGHIELKANPGSPDWGQTTLKWDSKWVPTNEIFQKYMDRVKFKPPPFLSGGMSHEEWLKIKPDYSDEYIDIDEQGIQEFYKKKDCAYIQIKGGYGLYHLGEDPLELNVPEFKLKQRIRIRAKVHSKTDSQLSVTAAFQPVDIKQLKPSMYSLDDKSRLPPNL